MGLCFGDVMKTMLITHQCFNYCLTVFTEHHSLFYFSRRSTSGQAGDALEFERGHSSGEEGEMEMFRVRVCLPKSQLCKMELCFSGDNCE